MAELAVVIVTWNVASLVLEALRSLFDDLAAHGPDAVVYVVDSASSDETPDAVAQAFPQVHLIASRENLGFGRANNLALRQIGFGNRAASDLPRAVYLLNPDTVTQPGATRALYDALMAEERCGLVGAQLEYDDHSFQHSAFYFPGLRQLWVEFFPTPGRLYESRFNGRYPRHLYASGTPFPVDCILGATMMLRREVIMQVGMFDEQFFMYSEEIDWAWRIRRAGWDVLCVPAARVTHLEGRSASQIRPLSIVNLWTSRLLFYRKHYPAWKVLAARLMIAAGMALKTRSAAALPLDQRQPLVDAYRAVQTKALGRA